MGLETFDAEGRPTPEGAARYLAKEAWRLPEIDSRRSLVRHDVRLAARVARLPPSDKMPAGDDAADASVRGTAGELVLVMYGRLPVDSLQLDGDRRVFDLLVDWEP